MIGVSLVRLIRFWVMMYGLISFLEWKLSFEGTFDHSSMVILFLPPRPKTCLIRFCNFWAQKDNFLIVVSKT